MFAVLQPHDVDRFVAIHLTLQGGNVALFNGHHSRGSRKVWRRYSGGMGKCYVNILNYFLNLKKLEYYTYN